MKPCVVIHIPLDGYTPNHPRKERKMMKNNRIGMMGAAMVAMAASMAAPMTATQGQQTQQTQKQQAIAPKTQTKVSQRRFKGNGKPKPKGYYKKGIPVKNPAQGLQMNKMHVAWATKKFGTCDTSNLFGYPLKA